MQVFSFERLYVLGKYINQINTINNSLVFYGNFTLKVSWLKAIKIGMLKLFTINRSVTVKIDEPCSEDWEQMRPLQGGRHCNVCAKRVTDFSGMGSAELARFAKANGKLCGRINSDLLNTPLQMEQPKKGRVLGLLLRAAVLVGITSAAQAKAPAYTIHHNNNVPVDEPTARDIKIVVKITDKAMGKPLQFSSVRVNQGTVVWSDGYTDSSGFIVVDRTIEKPNDSLVEVVVKSHFYHDKTVSLSVNNNNRFDVNIELDRIDMPANVVYGVVGEGKQYDENTVGAIFFGKNRIEVFDHPEIGVDVNSKGEYKLALPDTMLGKRVYLVRKDAAGRIIHTDGVTVTTEPVRLDFIDYPYSGIFFPNPEIITTGGPSIITYKWEWNPIVSISGLPYIVVTQVNWTGTELYVRAPFTRRNLPLYKSHWFRGE
jgi:hypothetical protein